MSKFDLKELIAEGKVSNLGTKGNREQIEYIHIDRIDDDPNNFYELSNIEELAANIELLGLQQPIRVRVNPEDPARVIIVSGHRRRAAIRMAIEGGREDLKEIPCIREVPAESAALQELRLIYANSDTRKLTSAEISKQAERVEMLLYQLKEEGYEFPGRMRDHVAEACKVSKSKLARLKVIREGLSPDYMEAFERNTLSEQAAYSLARLPIEFQRRLFRVTPIKNMLGHSVEVIQRMYEEGKRWDPQLTCPDGKSCAHGDAMLRHDLDNYSHCGGETCCLTCYEATRSWSPCERMCSKAKAQRKAAKEAEDAKQAKEDAKRISGIQKKTQANALRLLKAIDASGIPDKTKIAWDWRELTVADIRKYAAGEFTDKEQWYSEKLAPGDIRKPAAVAKILGCSTDFLFGLTDEPVPTGVATASKCTGLEWYPASVEPKPGTEIVVIDTYGVADSGMFYNAATFETAGLDWPDVALWTPQPTEATSDTLPAEPPAEGWLPLEFVNGMETPPRAGAYYCKFDCEGTILRQVAWWDSGLGVWCFKEHGVKIDAKCLKWFPLPEEED